MRSLGPRPLALRASDAKLVVAMQLDASASILRNFMDLHALGICL